jgi:hypothetical protein
MTCRSGNLYQAPMGVNLYPNIFVRGQDKYVQNVKYQMQKMHENALSFLTALCILQCSFYAVSDSADGALALSPTALSPSVLMLPDILATLIPNSKII